MYMTNRRTVGGLARLECDNLRLAGLSPASEVRKKTSIFRPSVRDCEKSDISLSLKTKLIRMKESSRLKLQSEFCVDES